MEPFTCPVAYSALLLTSIMAAPSLISCAKSPFDDLNKFLNIDNIMLLFTRQKYDLSHFLTVTNVTQQKKQLKKPLLVLDAIAEW